MTEATTYTAEMALKILLKATPKVTPQPGPTLGKVVMMPIMATAFGKKTGCTPSLLAAAQSSCYPASTIGQEEKTKDKVGRGHRDKTVIICRPYDHQIFLQTRKISN